MAERSGTWQQTKIILVRIKLRTLVNNKLEYSLVAKALALQASYQEFESLYSNQNAPMMKLVVHAKLKISCESVQVQILFGVLYASMMQL